MSMYFGESFCLSKLAAALNMEHTDEVVSDIHYFNGKTEEKLFAASIFPFIPLNGVNDVNQITWYVETRSNADDKDGKESEKKEKVEVVNNYSSFSSINNMVEVLSKMMDVYLFSVEKEVPMDPYKFALQIQNDALAIFGKDVELVFTSQVLDSNIFKGMTRKEATIYATKLFITKFIGLNFEDLVDKNIILGIKMNLLEQLLKLRIKEMKAQKTTNCTTKTKSNVCKNVRRVS